MSINAEQELSMRQIKQSNCHHSIGLLRDPCCGDIDNAHSTYMCVECEKPVDREEWEYKYDKDWDEYRYGT